MHGGYLSATEAASRAKKILEQEYRQHGGTIVTAYNDAHDGTNGGLRVVLDKLAKPSRPNPWKGISGKPLTDT